MLDVVSAKPQAAADTIVLSQRQPSVSLARMLCPIAVGKRRDAIPRPRNIAEMNPAKRRRLCAEKPGKGDPVLAKLAASTAGGTHRSQLAKLVAAAKKTTKWVN